MFIILIAVALYAALSYAVINSDRANYKEIDDEKAQLDQAVSENCQANVDYAKQKLEILNGCSADEMNYVLPSGVNDNPNAAPNGRCDVFYPGRGGATPCGAYIDIDCELSLIMLEIGEECGGIIYAGESGGNRIYTSGANQGIETWNNGTNNSFITNVQSLSDGLSNTNTLISLTDIGSPYKAALLCRSLGENWYLPSRNEMSLLISNKNERDLSGSFPAGLYSTSTEHTASANSDEFILTLQVSGATGAHRKRTAYNIRCVRRD